MADRIVEVLQACLAEQSQVEVHFGGSRIQGTVTRVDDVAVELRHGNARSVIRIAKVDAITTE